MSEKSLRDKWEDYCRNLKSFPPLPSHGFEAGYRLAQEEMKARLTECEEALSIAEDNLLDENISTGRAHDAMKAYYSKWGGE